MGKVKIKLNLRLISMLVFSALLIYLIFYFYQASRPITAYQIDGFKFVFRNDLRKANKIPVYPSEDAVYLKLINPIVKNVTIAFKDAGEKENSLYAVESYEIAYKLTLFYKIKGMEVGFDSMQVDSYENLPGKIQNPIIALVAPKFSNETAIRIEDHVIYVKGKNKEEFDLAVIKLLMCALRIKLG